MSATSITFKEGPWNSAWFDETKISHTRPGFGLLAMIPSGQKAHEIRDRYNDQLLIKSRDDVMHVTIFQAFLIPGPDYNPASLPNDLLQKFHQHMTSALADDIAGIQEKLSTTKVHLTGEILLLGRVYPSHLALEVDCKEPQQLLLNLKRKSIVVAKDWMTTAIESIRARGFLAYLGSSDNGTAIMGDGWQLVIGYTENPTYKTHVTLGMFPTGNARCDQLLLQLHDHKDREIEAVFGEEQTKDNDWSEIHTECDGLMYQVMLTKLSEIDLDDEVQTKYPELAAQIGNLIAKRPVNVTVPMIDQWGEMLLKKKIFSGELAPLKNEDAGYAMAIEKMSGGLINMNRIQNFVPGGAAPVTTEL